MALVYRTQPSNGVASSTASFSPAVEVDVVDGAGNVVSSATNAISIAFGSAPSGATLGGTATRNASGGIAVFPDLAITKASTGYSLSATSSGLTGATSGFFTIQPGSPAQIAFAVQPTSATAGVMSPAPAVTLSDAFGNAVSPVTVTLNLISNPGNAVPTGASTTSSGGVATFSSFGITRTGKGYTLAARAAGLRVTSGPFDMVAGSPASLAFVTQPTGAAPGRPVVPAVRVALLDSLGNVCDSSSDTISLALGPTPANGAVISGGAAIATTNGVASFEGVQLDRDGAGYTLVASSTGGLAAKSSRGFDVASDARFFGADAIPLDVVPHKAAVGDLNGDGVPDLAVVDFNNHKLSILLGEGSDRFSAPTTINLSPNVTYPHDVLLVDLDRDGKLDLVVVGSGSNNVAVFMGNGDGTFGPPTYFAVGTNPQMGVAVGDFDEDGNLDLALGCAFTTNFTVLYGDGKGGFPRRGDFGSGGNQPHGVDCADLDGDGHLDIAVCNRLSDSVEIFKGDGNGNFTPVANVAVGSEPRHVRLVDVNGDGRWDVLTGNESGHSLSVSLNGGGFSFQTATSYDVASNQVMVAVGDLNDDSRPDLVAASGGPRVLFGDGTGAFNSPQLSPSGPGPNFVALADFEGAGYLDMLVSNELDLGSTGLTKETFTLYRNLGGRAFAFAPAFPAGATPSGLAAADLNGDGFADVVVCNPSANTVSVCLGGPGGSLGTPTTYAVGTGPAAVRLADLNKDGFLDLVTCDSGGNTVTVLLGASGGAFGSATSYAAGTGPSDIALADVDGDGILDCIVANPTTDEVNVLIGTGSGGFAAPTSYTVTNGPRAIAVVDVNGDHKPDVIVTTPGANQIAVLMNLGTGTFGTAATYAAGPSPQALAVGDVNGDGLPDIVVANGSGTASVLLGVGGGAFGAPTALTVGVEPSAITLADLDGDGRLDIVVANRTSRDVSILMGRGAGSFAPERRYAVGNGPVALAVADVDGDKRADVIVTNAGDGTVSVLLGLSESVITDTVDSHANLFNTPWPGNPYGTPWPGNSWGGALDTPGAVNARSVVVDGAPRDFGGAAFVDLSATGLIQADAANYTGPDGWVGTGYRGLTMFGLIGIWSSDPVSIMPIGSDFDIGSKKTLAVPVASHAYLFLAENDGAFSDDSGFFSVVISVR